MFQKVMKKTRFLVFGFLAFFAAVPQTNGGLLSFIDELFLDTPIADRTLRSLVSNEQLYSRLIREMIPEGTSTITAGAFKKALRTEVFTFVSNTQVSWNRTDLVDFFNVLLSRSCTANVSCQVAFDLTPGQVGPFLDEISETMARAADSRIPTLEREIAEMAPGDARVAKEAELQRLNNYKSTSSRLAGRSTGDEFDDLMSLLSKCEKPR